MKVLLVLRQEKKSQPVVLLVGLDGPVLKRRVKALIHQDRVRDVFDLAMNNGIPEQYFPSGSMVSARPDLTLIEDLL